MRKLTLHEKITIKGIISNYTNNPTPLLNMKQALYCFHRMTGKSIKYYYLFKCKGRK